MPFSQLHFHPEALSSVGGNGKTFKVSNEWDQGMNIHVTLKIKIKK